MGRKTKLTPSRFKAVWPYCTSVNQAAKKLGVSYVCVYAMIKRLNLPTKTENRISALEENIDELYVEGMNVGSIAEAFELSSNAVRYHIMHIVDRKFADITEYPKPTSPSAYLITKMLIKEPELFDKPEEISSRTMLNIGIVHNVLGCIFNHRSKNARAD